MPRASDFGVSHKKSDYSLPDLRLEILFDVLQWLDESPIDRSTSGPLPVIIRQSEGQTAMAA